MTKKVIVSFDFDSETDSVSNVTCIVDGVEKKKKTTKKVSKDVVLEEESLITLEENKLVFNNKSIQDLGIIPESRIIIKYEKVGKNNVPIIGTDTSFDEEGNGNKITKSNTVTYKGKQNTILSEYGNEFTIEPYKDGIFKLISKGGSKTVTKQETHSLETLVTKAEGYDVGVFTDDDSNTEITDFSFSL